MDKSQVVIIDFHDYILTKEEVNYLWNIADDLVLYVGEYKALIEHGLKFYLEFKKTCQIK